jgi:hypothetical protein
MSLLLDNRKKNRSEYFHRYYIHHRYNNTKTKRMYYINSARRRGIEFNLTYEECDQLFNNPCYYCGSKTERLYLNGIDRKDNTKNYTVDNCVSCCKSCNMAKGTMTVEEFIDLSRKITRNHIRQTKNPDTRPIHEYKDNTARFRTTILVTNSSF